MDITEWFDTTNKDHLQAYLHLAKCGTWPVGFIPENIKFGCIWQSTLALKMATKYCEQNTSNAS